jgi:hypothetical protein
VAYSLSLRNLEEMIAQGDFLRGVAERGFEVDHSNGASRQGCRAALLRERYRSERRA